MISNFEKYFRVFALIGEATILISLFSLGDVKQFAALGTNLNISIFAAVLLMHGISFLVDVYLWQLSFNRPAITGVSTGYYY